jgi:hypothetical protein
VPDGKQHLKWHHHFVVFHEVAGDEQDALRHM